LPSRAPGLWAHALPSVSISILFLLLLILSNAGAAAAVYAIQCLLLSVQPAGTVVM
jgi:hypothetical protein